MLNYTDILLVSDFDRTLTAPDSSIPTANLEAIRRFTDRGGLFTVGTGRSVPMYRPYREIIPTNAPLILYNGAAAYDYDTETLSGTVWMPTGRELLEYLLDAFPDLLLEVQGVDAHYLIGEDPGREAFYRAQGVNARTVPVTEAPERYHKLALFGRFAGNDVGQFYRGTPEENARFTACQERIMRDWPMLRADRAAMKIIDLQDKRAGKGAAARALAKRLGRKCLVCAGDAMNDASMLREADLAFAPADCVPELMALGLCTLVRPCVEGSIAAVVEYLEAHCLQKV
ncbi:MAG: HAD family phosphatase [Oscillospiraceae bacterium]|nr:HAD family phosphatase [Oscillospiraceae bacterium]